MPPSALRLHAATALVSGTVLLLEILYTRLFSFAIWYHFAYATIALALLGFGASGALLATRPTLPGPRAALRAPGRRRRSREPARGSGSPSWS